MRNQYIQYIYLFQRLLCNPTVVLKCVSSCEWDNSVKLKGLCDCSENTYWVTGCNWIIINRASVNVVTVWAVLCSFTLKGALYLHVCVFVCVCLCVCIYNHVMWGSLDSYQGGNEKAVLLGKASVWYDDKGSCGAQVFPSFILHLFLSSFPPFSSPVLSFLWRWYPQASVISFTPTRV